jgi:hypothetical protein
VRASKFTGQADASPVFLRNPFDFQSHGRSLNPLM